MVGPDVHVYLYTNIYSIYLWLVTTTAFPALRAKLAVRDTRQVD
jgi:hypothetical protein